MPVAFLYDIYRFIYFAEKKLSTLHRRSIIISFVFYPRNNSVSRFNSRVNKIAFSVFEFSVHKGINL